MSTYVVLFRKPGTLPADKPSSFKVEAKDEDEAEDITWECFPDSLIAWVFEGDSVEEAYRDFYSTSLED